MPRIELDQAKPCDASAIDKFYEANLGKIVKSPNSPTPSQRTISSTSSIVRVIERKHNASESSSTTASCEDDDGLELDAVPNKEQFLRYHNEANLTSGSHIQSTDGNVIVVTNADKESAHANSPRIDTVAIQNSTDIQFGNKTFYNGPVTIKQFWLDDKSNKWISRTNDGIENGLSNEGFEGIQSPENTAKSSSATPKSHLESNTKQSYSPRRVFVALLTATLVILAIILVAILFVYTQKHSEAGEDDESRRNPFNSTIGNDLLTGKVLRLIKRLDWLAQPPRNKLDLLDLPVGRVVITHTATEDCLSQSACTLQVRLIQTFHIEGRQWDDIGYNFLVGGDGSVYEGRGWDKQGAHTLGYNKGSIGIAYIGTFNTELPNEKQIVAGFLLMQEGVKLNKITPDYKIYAHRQLIPSESPGAAFFETIKKWPHWTNEEPKVF